MVAPTTSPNEYRVKLKRPHAGQEKVNAEARRFNTVACGRRWGKTEFGVQKGVQTMLDGGKVAWMAPTYKFLLEAWRNLKDTCAPVLKNKNEADKRLELVTGGSVDCWSLDNEDAGRGYNYHRVIVDEAAMVNNLRVIWTEAIRPTLADHQGDAWFLSTPKGMDFFYELYQRGKTDPKIYASWQMPTSANPFIAKEEVEAAKDELPERAFQQEWLAAFLEDAGGVFRGVTAATEEGHDKNEPPRADGQYQIGVDLARVMDWTVITVIDTTTGRQVYHERFNQISWERQMMSIEAVWQRYGGVVVIDSTGVGDVPTETLRRKGIPVRPYHFTNVSKEVLIDNLASAIEHGRVRLMDLPVQTMELRAFQYMITPGRNVRMGAPEGMHDDCVIALALAAHGINEPKVETRRVVRRGGWL